MITGMKRKKHKHLVRNKVKPPTYRITFYNIATDVMDNVDLLSSETHY